VRAEIEYARSGGVAIAHQVVGEGEVDLAYVPEWGSNLVHVWQSRFWRSFYERLAQSFRLILFDKRGTGLSDHGAHFAALETRMEDLQAVLNAVGSSSAVVYGGREGCAMAALYAATHPERTRALVLFHPAVRGRGTTDRAVQQGLDELRQGWGTRSYAEQLLQENFPSLVGDEDFRRWFVDWERVGMSPAVAYALNRAYMETDLSDVLPAVRVPTLVLYRHSTGGSEEDALEVAAQIPDAQLTRLSGGDPSGPFLSPELPEEIERFVAGEKAPAMPTSALTTVMFTDLVGSTERAAQLGDQAWRELLVTHHALVRRELARYHGDERDTAGDGFFATFDGPARAVHASHSILTGLRRLGLDARIGIHVGECELHDGKPTGLAVNIGARIAAAADAGDILVSSIVKDLVAGSGLTFDDRGMHELKGVPGEWHLYAVRAT
jgi:class 3 adenylate cyclase